MQTRPYFHIFNDFKFSVDVLLVFSGIKVFVHLHLNIPPKLRENIAYNVTIALTTESHCILTTSGIGGAQPIRLQHLHLVN